MAWRDMTTCNHYWTVVGPVRDRWVYGHALASCRFCQAFTVIDRGGVGPCPHSFGMNAGEQLHPGEPPLPKEAEICDACLAITQRADYAEMTEEQVFAEMCEPCRTQVE